MKVGIYLGNLKPEAGGGFNFENSLLKALLNTKTEHQYVFFYNSDVQTESRNTKHIKFINLFKKDVQKNFLQKLLTKFNRFKYFFINEKFKDDEKSDLQTAIEEENIELIWFMVPLTAQKVSIPFIYTVWDLAHRIHPYFPEVSDNKNWEYREREYSYWLKKATYVITGAEAGKNELIQFYGLDAERIKVIPLPLPDLNISKEKNHTQSERISNDSKPYLFYPAQFWPHKNHICILLAVKKLIEKFNLNFGVIFTGFDKGNMAYIKKMTVELGLQNNVKFKGFVSREELNELYMHAFALVFPSYFGPDNLPPLEAFALSCPVISASVPGSKEQLGDAALLFNPDDENMLAEKIKLLFENSSLKSEMIAKGIKIVAEKTPEKYIEKFIQILDEFSTKRRCWSSDEKYIHI